MVSVWIRIFSKFHMKKKLFLKANFTLNSFTYLKVLRFFV